MSTGCVSLLLPARDTSLGVVPGQSVPCPLGSAGSAQGLRKEVTSDWGRSQVGELADMGLLENCWAKLSPFPESTNNHRGQGAGTAFQNCALKTWLSACLLQRSRSRKVPTARQRLPRVSMRRSMGLASHRSSGHYTRTEGYLRPKESAFYEAWYEDSVLCLTR